jgi:hypothetical protein
MMGQNGVLQAKRGGYFFDSKSTGIEPCGKTQLRKELKGAIDGAARNELTFRKSKYIG